MESQTCQDTRFRSFKGLWNGQKSWDLFSFSLTDSHRAKAENSSKNRNPACSGDEERKNRKPNGINFSIKSIPFHPIGFFSKFSFKG